MRLATSIPIALAIMFSLDASFALGAEKDILESALKNPLLGRLHNGKSVKYGNPNLIAAEKALTNVSKPWTVPKIVRIYLKEKALWMDKLKERIKNNNPEMWPTARAESKRMAHLATVLGASRDPRAAFALESGIAEDRLVGGFSAIEAIHDYFLKLPCYKQLPPGKPSAGNIGPDMARDAKLWLRLNRE
jgi:hypothetical protein